MHTFPKKGQPDQEKNVLSQLWFKYFPYWPLFLILLAVAGAGAWFYVRYKTSPYYIATASILIKDEKKGQDEAKMLESLNQLSAKKIIENEIEVIRSRELLSQVARKLHLYAPIYEKHKVLPLSGYTSSPVRIQANNPDSLVTNAGDVFFTMDSSRTQVVINGQAYPLNKWVSTPFGNLRFVPNNITGYSPAQQFYFNLVDPKK